MYAIRSYYVYHIGQEALNNALKHAHASAVTITISQPAGSQRLEFEVADDGQGFDVAALNESGGLGLLSIHERVENMNGELELRSAPGQGTTVITSYSIHYTKLYEVENVNGELELRSAPGQGTAVRVMVEIRP